MISLKNVLRINALSSGATGVALILFGNPVAKLFGVSHPQPFWITGIFLTAFAALVFKESTHDHAKPNKVKFIIVLDSLWVMGSIIIVTLQLFDLSFIGYSAITAVALWVGLMAYLQTLGLKKVNV